MSDFLPSTKFINVARTVTVSTTVEDSDQVLNCDTTLAAVTIYLKKIPSNYWSTLTKLYVKDFGGNASTYNITIVAPTGYKINNQQSIVINVDDGSALVRIGSNTDYVAELNYGIVGNNAIAVKNTAYVMKNGSDTTGLVERFDKPFLTISAANAAIRAAYPDTVRSYLNRFKIIVEDGTYTETVIYCFPYIDFDFGNSVISAKISDSFSDPQPTYSSNPRNDFTTKIFGNARLFNNGFHSLEILNVNSRILVQADTLSSNWDDVITIQNGYLRIICNKIFNNNTLNTFPQFAHCIEMTQGYSGSNPLPKCTLEVVGADIYMVGNVNATPIHFCAAGGSLTPLDQTLSLYNCRVISNLGAAPDNAKLSAIAVGVTHPAPPGSTLNLYNTVLYSKYGQTIFMSNATAQANLTVYYYNSNTGNTDSLLVTPDANHVLTEYIKTTGFVINTDVLPIIP